MEKQMGSLVYYLGPNYYCEELHIRVNIQILKSFKNFISNHQNV